MVKHIFISILTIILISTTAAFSQAQNGETAPPIPNEMVYRMLEAGEPDAEHEELAKWEGIWDTETKTWWQGQDHPPAISHGTQRCELVFGGRWLKFSSEGEFAEKDWKSTGFLGYENMGGVYMMCWVESLSTELYFASGVRDDNGELFLNGANDKPTTRERNVPVRYKIFWNSDTERVVQCFEHAGSDKESLASETTYTLQTDSGN